MCASWRRRVVITDDVIDSMASQFAYQKCSAPASRQKINEFINQRRIPLPDRAA
jgi:hypothetical protein